MASETYGNTIIVTANNFVDLTTVYAPAATAASWVQNRGPRNLLVAFSTSAAAPNDGGRMIRSGEVATGNSTHIWVKSLGGADSIVSVGLV